MALDISSAIRNGIDRTIQRNGLLLMGVFLILKLVSAVASQTLTRANIAFLSRLSESGAVPDPTTGGGASPTTPPFLGPSFGAGGGDIPLALTMSLPAAMGIALAVSLLAESVRIVAIRTFVSDHLDTIPAEFVRRNIVVATLNGFVGGIVVLVLTAIGLILLIVPGVFLALVFFFVRQEIAVEDENFVDAMAGSWYLTAGNRIELFGLALVLFAITLLAAIPSVAVGFVSPIGAVVVSAVLSSITTVFGIAVVARAYDQLRTERAQHRDAVIDAGT